MLLTTGAATTIVGAGLGAGAVALFGSPGRGPSLWTRPDRSGAQPVGGLHLQFGRDASTEVVVSWHTTDPVSNPRVMVGTSTAGFGRTVPAETRTYRDAKSNTEVRVHHARLDNLAPDTDYVYAAVHDGTNPELGTVRTAPSGRNPLRFTSFGDQATPTLGRLNKNGYRSDNLGSPAAGDITTAIERIGPLFNLVNGDLCYANLAHDRIRTWSDWFDNNTRSARYRPWMPAAGNHENELGNGPIGYAAYQTYFALPDAGSDGELRGLWYSFTAGSVRIISLNNDDICFQDGGNSYVHGYSGGAQKRWLEKELANARADKRVDWVIVCMHQTAISTADHTNGADLGIRQEWLPLFDRYQVDLVVCGHEHHYERSHPLRGAQDTETRTPIPGRRPRRRHRHDQGHRARRHRRRRHIVAVEQLVLSRASMPGGDRYRCRHRPDRTESTHICGGGSAVVGVQRQPKPLWLRRFRCRPRAAGRQHLDQGDPLRGQRTLRRDQRGRAVHADAASRRLSVEALPARQPADNVITALG